MSHFAFTFLIAVLLAAACALTGRFTWAERGYRFAYFAVTGIAWIAGLSWLMRIVQS